MHKSCFAEKFFHFAHTIIENHDEAGVSAENAKKIKEIKIKAKKELIQDTAFVDMLAVDIISKLMEEKIDTAEINKLLDKKYEAKKEGMKKLVAAFAEIKKMLSKEQLGKLKAICKKDGQFQPRQAECCK